MTNSFFGGMSSTEGLEKTGDRLGGFTPVDSNIYPANIALAYAVVSDGGAKGVVFHFDLEIRDDQGNLKDTREMRETIWVTKKTGENFYIGKTDGKKYPMPGFAQVDELCILASAENKDFLNQKIEEKVIPVWDKDAKAEVNRPMPVFTDLLDQKVHLGIMRVKQDKTKKEGETYVPTGETVEVNEIEKAFHHETHQTVTEAREGKASGFYEQWVKKNKGQIKDKTTRGSNQGKPGAPGAKPVAGGSAAPSASSLFNKGG